MQERLVTLEPELSHMGNAYQLIERTKTLASMHGKVCVDCPTKDMYDRLTIAFGSHPNIRLTKGYDEYDV